LRAAVTDLCLRPHRLQNDSFSGLPRFRFFSAIKYTIAPIGIVVNNYFALKIRDARPREGTGRGSCMCLVIWFVALLSVEYAYLSSFSPKSRII
jgi:hypothetical protein